LSAMILTEGTAARRRHRRASNMLRQRVRCTHCGARGATLTHPSWHDEQIGLAPFPVERIAP
jgi:hypothetical protein